MNKGVFWVAVVVVGAAVAGTAYWLGSRQNLAGQSSASQPQPSASAAGNVKAGQTPPPTAVDAASVKLVPLSKAITAVGSLRSDETVIVRPEVSGRITEIGFREGQPVAKGTTLVRLDQSIQRAELLQ